MSSYYGGKPGGAFIIVKSFASVQEMATEFAKGPSYKDVNFDEYVLINTVNKNNPENGQIFKRGFDYKTTEKIKSYKEAGSASNIGKVYAETAVVSGGAIYVGTMVGPAGRAPMLHFGQYEDVKDSQEVASKTLTELGLEYSENLTDVDVLAKLNELYPNGTNIYGDDLTRDYNCVQIMFGDDYRYYFCDNFLWNGHNHLSAGWFRVESAPAAGQDSYSLDSASLVPGVTYDGYETDETGRKHLKPASYQDTIDWRYATVRNENHEDSTSFIGFRFGVPVVEFEAEAVDAYYNRNDAEESLVYDNINLITPVSTDSVVEGQTVKHPFYSKWDIKIPKGVKGDCISNIRVVTASADLMMLDVDENGNLVYNEDKTELSVSAYNDEDDIANGRKIIVCDYTNYDRVPSGDTGVIYLGDYNMIDDITVTENGSVTIDYSHDDNLEYPELITWLTSLALSDEGTFTVTFNNNRLIENISEPNKVTWLTGLSLDKENGQFVVTFNNQAHENTQDIEQFLTWVKNISMDEFGSITYTHTTSEDDRTDEKVINWIKSFTFDKETGKLNVQFNNDNLTDFEHTLNYIKDIQLRPEDNHIIVTHSDPEKYDNGVQDLGSIQHIIVGPEGTDTSNLATHGIWFVTE